jgi:hypothetical protein
MIALNQNLVAVAVAVAVLMVCYFVYREVRRTQEEVTGLKDFSTRVSAKLRSMDNYIQPKEPEEEEEEEEVIDDEENEEEKKNA